MRGGRIEEEQCGTLGIVGLLAEVLLDLWEQKIAVAQNR